MPEGDTIWRAARALHEALAGRTLTGFDSPLPAILSAGRRLHVVGQLVEAVEARGKHLLVRFSGGTLLHTHQRMTGSWHLYRRGGPWRRSAIRARIVLEAGDVVAVCFDSPVVEWLAPNQAARHATLTRLGPDLLAADFDPIEARARLRRRAESEIGVALLDQTALAGIGNVYKSEVLFLCSVSPFARVAAIDDATLDHLIAETTRQMRRNLGPGRRRTTSGLAPQRFWVYRRAGHPCRRCGETIRRAAQGESPRSTYWCPRCQCVRATTSVVPELG